MCWCWPFAGKPSPPPPKKKKSRPSPKRSDARSEKSAYEGNVAEPVVVAYPDPAQPELQKPPEHRRMRERRPQETRSQPRTPKKTKPPPEYQHETPPPSHRSHNSNPRRALPQSPSKRTCDPPATTLGRQRDARRPTVHLQVPDRFYRSVSSASSSTEMLLNPRPDRARHTRQRHSRPSTSTLRGRGAKRDPPSSKSKKTSSGSKSEGKKGQWSRIASPPKPSRREREQASQSQQQRSPRQRSSRSRTPNMTARRVPDRRFAVLAATNAALEDIRREAFTYPSPPPRTGRVQRYQGVAVESNTIPWTWDCVSSSYQPTVVSEERTEGGRRRRRR